MFVEAQDGIIELSNSVKVLHVHLGSSFAQTDLRLGGFGAVFGIVAREFAPVALCQRCGLLRLGIRDLWTLLMWLVRLKKSLWLGIWLRIVLRLLLTRLLL